MSKFHLEKIDAVRGIAILLVFGYHVQLLISPKFEVLKYDDNGIMEFDGFMSFFMKFNPFGLGWMGVQLFLVISGFLIHLIYIRSGDRLHKLEFFSKRFWRIYPAYLLAMVVFFVSTPDYTLRGAKDFFAHLFLVHNLHDYTFFTINPSFWSIALEVQLYLLFPFLLILIRYLGISISMNLSLGIYLVMGVIGYWFGIASWLYYLSALSLWFVWCFGAYLAFLYHQGKKFFRHPFSALIILYAFILLTLTVGNLGYVKMVPVTLFCGALLELFLHNPVLDNRAFSRGLVKILSVIGVFSYSFYLIHQPFLGDLITFFSLETEWEIFNFGFAVLLSFGLLSLFSFLLYRAIELNGIRFGRRLRERRQLKDRDNTKEAEVVFLD